MVFKIPTKMLWKKIAAKKETNKQPILKSWSTGPLASPKAVEKNRTPKIV